VRDAGGRIVNGVQGDRAEILILDSSRVAYERLLRGLNKLGARRDLFGQTIAGANHRLVRSAERSRY